MGEIRVQNKHPGARIGPRHLIVITGPVTGTDSVVILGISSLPEGNGSAGPAIMTDTTTVSSSASLANGGVSPPPPRGITDLPREIDIPSTTTSVVISEPVKTRLTEPTVGPQSTKTSIGIGSQSSPYECVLALLADPDPNKDIFRTDLSFFVLFFNGMIEKLLHQGYCFDQFRRSLSRYMTMIREEGYPELADSLTADFVVLDELQSHENSVVQLMATLARKDTDRAELLSSLDSNREEVDRLKKVLKYAEESGAIFTEELARLESSRGQTLERLGSTQERLMKLKNEAVKILSSSEASVRADLQVELEQSYADRLSNGHNAYRIFGKPSAINGFDMPLPITEKGTQHRVLDDDLSLLRLRDKIPQVWTLVSFSIGERLNQRCVLDTDFRIFGKFPAFNGFDVHLPIIV
uniref:Uncharacterized protein n=1 Tax=Asparagus officinalis TaxID=4686 RepID=Q2XNY1_ASPOF|nr:hypothetical protein 10.t00038 [Asparagus officinalis]